MTRTITSSTFLPLSTVSVVTLEILMEVEWVVETTGDVCTSDNDRPESFLVLLVTRPTTDPCGFDVFIVNGFLLVVLHGENPRKGTSDHRRLSNDLLYRESQGRPSDVNRGMHDLIGKYNLFVCCFCFGTSGLMMISP